MASLTSDYPAGPGGPLPWPLRPGARPSLAQCVTLALLIHILVVLVFGSAPGGSARPGEGVWGTLNIRLTGSDAGGRNEATVAADAHSGPAGTATRQRFGGAVRSPDLAEPVPPSPGAARQGIWQARPAEPQAAHNAPPVTPAPAATVATAATAATTATAATAATAATPPPVATPPTPTTAVEARPVAVAPSETAPAQRLSMPSPLTLPPAQPLQAAGTAERALGHLVPDQIFQLLLELGGRAGCGAGRAPQNPRR